ncbi:TPA: hypothetical protein H2R31_004997 [Salmonella enterica]|uniref:Uncharacterized protein n=1 Tax=Salmonella enterica TaxID=28901 RepID=A0A633LE16_SALER|nr:hypothetical protein [Salmonella enterica]EDH5794072.1 hypothetical protein [Salmonella enterica subsp. enterica serovar Newport]ELC8790491.1 hypothetical protein [Salmonella enterica]EMA3634741.1 hypothetical protein [Salmonella enterica]HAK6119839.1 hypothetical protein [Salmonella enterica]
MRFIIFIVIILMGSQSAYADIRENTVIITGTTQKALTDCLSESLRSHGYYLGNKTHIPGVADEYPAFSYQRNKITGIFWITPSPFGSDEKTVGIYPVNDESIKSLLETLLYCKTELSSQNTIQ